jgi:hypothetical protein
VFHISIEVEEIYCGTGFKILNKIKSAEMVVV